MAPKKRTAKSPQSAAAKPKAAKSKAKSKSPAKPKAKAKPAAAKARSIARSAAAAVAKEPAQATAAPSKKRRAAAASPSRGRKRAKAAANADVSTATAAAAGENGAADDVVDSSPAPAAASPKRKAGRRGKAAAAAAAAADDADATGADGGADAAVPAHALVAVADPNKLDVTLKVDGATERYSSVHVTATALLIGDDGGGGVRVRAVYRCRPGQGAAADPALNPTRRLSVGLDDDADAHPPLTTLQFGGQWAGVSVADARARLSDPKYRVVRNAKALVFPAADGTRWQLGVVKFKCGVCGRTAAGAVECAHCDARSAATGLTRAERELLFSAQQACCGLCAQELVSAHHPSTVVSRDTRFDLPSAAGHASGSGSSSGGAHAFTAESARAGVRGLVHAACAAALVPFDTKFHADAYSPLRAVVQFARVIEFVTAPAAAHTALGTAAAWAPGGAAAASGGVHDTPSKHHGPSLRALARTANDAKSAAAALEHALEVVKTYERDAVAAHATAVAQHAALRRASSGAAASPAKPDRSAAPVAPATAAAAAAAADAPASASASGAGDGDVSLPAVD